MKYKKRNRVIVYIVLTIFCLCTLIPCALIFVTSLRTTQEIARYGLFGNVSTLHFSNYADAWKVGRLGKYFWNSIVVAVFTVIFTLLFSIFGSYATVIYEFRGKKLFEILMNIGLIIPLEIIVIPLYYNLQKMHLMNTHLAIIFPSIAMNIPFGIFLLAGFIKGIPQSLIDSAKLDGANEWKMLWKIIVPLIRPAIIALLIFIFMWTWNSFMLPNIVIRSESLRTLPLGLDFFRGKHVTNVPLIAAASNIISLPVIIIYLIFQKNLIAGMTMGAVKG